MDTVRYELGAPFPFEEGCRKSSAVGHAPLPHQFLADQLSLFQPGWVNYAHQINAAPLQIFGPSAASGAGLGQKRKRQLAAYLAKNIQITIIRTHWKVRVCAKLQK